MMRGLRRGQPLGPESWIDQCVGKLGLESTIPPRGRPKLCIKWTWPLFLPGVATCGNCGAGVSPAGVPARSARDAVVAVENAGVESLPRWRFGLVSRGPSGAGGCLLN
jgi:hypothetical protein